MDSKEGNMIGSAYLFFNDLPEEKVLNPLQSWALSR